MSRLAWLVDPRHRRGIYRPPRARTSPGLKFVIWNTRAVHGRVVAAAAPRGAGEPPAPPAPPDTKPPRNLLAAATPAAAQAVVAAAAALRGDSLRAWRRSAARPSRARATTAPTVASRNRYPAVPAPASPRTRALVPMPDEDDASRRRWRASPARASASASASTPRSSRAPPPPTRRRTRRDVFSARPFHLLPLAALQKMKADIKRVFRSRADVSAC